MKRFSDLSQEEIRRMSDEEFKAVSPFEKKNCADCKFLKAAVTYWCVNEMACKVRGTKIPGVIKCHFWEPDWSHIDKQHRTEENRYVSPSLLNKIKNFFR